VQGIRLDQHPLKIQHGQQLFESGALAGFAGVVGLLGQGHAKGSGVDGDLGDKTVTAVLLLNSRAPQRLAVTHPLTNSLAPPGIWLIIQAWST
jgi:hypothetical protein